MRLAPVLALLLCVPLAGCLQSRVQERGVGAYRLVGDYADRDELQALLADNQRLADELCPDGWFKHHDFDRSEGGRRVVVWEISCDAPYQFENVQKKVN